jgi:threonine/homoserine/homoserine lactone efflux protein
LFVNLGNPKPILFCSALLPSFLDMRSSPAVDFALLLLTGIVTAVSLLVCGLYVVLTARPRQFLVSSQLARRIQQPQG